MYAFQPEPHHHSPHHHHHHHHQHHHNNHEHDHEEKNSPKSQESDEDDAGDVVIANSTCIPTNRMSPSCSHGSTACGGGVTMPLVASDHMAEDNIDLPSCIYANRGAIGASGVHHHHHHHHHHHIGAEHMTDDCIHDNSSVLLNEDGYFNGGNCSPYRVQRQAANIRERKRMLRVRISNEKQL